MELYVSSESLPPLEYDHWKGTYQTLHLWSQIIGKIRLAHEAWTNHSWYSTLYVTSRGLSTLAVPNENENFTIELNLVDRTLDIEVSDGGKASLPLVNETVASFYQRVIGSLWQFGIESKFVARPNELIESIPFNKNISPRTFRPDQARNFFEVLVPINNWLKDFRSQFLGKCSPVHFFWGSFDLAVTRFSGRRAPEHPGGIPNLPDRVAREAYSHEVSSCGFWPGNDLYPKAAFYSYAYPEPPGFAQTALQPAGAFYHPELREFLLPYDIVRESKSPRQMAMSFFQSSYEAAANLGRWDRKLLEESPYREACLKASSH